MMTDPIHALRSAAAGGDAAAQCALAAAFYGSGDAAQGLSWLGRAAKSGHLPAMTELGARLVVGAGAPHAAEDGVALLNFAAEAGDGQAARYLATLRATGIGVPQDWRIAYAWLEKAAACDDAAASADLALLTACAGTAPSGALPAQDILAAWQTLPAIRPLSADPRIGIVEGFLPRALCDQLIAAAEDRLKPAEVTDSVTGKAVADPVRDNSFAQVRLFDLTLPLTLLRAQMARIVGQDTACFEVMNLLNYAPGQRYEPHVDYLDPARPGFADELRIRGQRVATFLVYLNDDFDGGETAFTKAGCSFRGKAGDAVFFMNVTEQGAVDPHTEHSGRPPTTGRKWLLSQWIRDRAQPVY